MTHRLHPFPGAQRPGLLHVGTTLALWGSTRLASAALRAACGVTLLGLGACGAAASDDWEGRAQPEEGAPYGSGEFYSEPEVPEVEPSVEMTREELAALLAARQPSGSDVGVPGPARSMQLPSFEGHRGGVAEGTEPRDRALAPDDTPVGRPSEDFDSDLDSGVGDAGTP